MAAFMSKEKVCPARVGFPDTSTPEIPHWPNAGKYTIHGLGLDTPVIELPEFPCRISHNPHKLRISGNASPRKVF